MQMSNMCLLFSYFAYLLRYGHLNTPRSDNKILHFEYYNQFIFVVFHGCHSAFQFYCKFMSISKYALAEFMMTSHRFYFIYTRHEALL